MHQISHNAPFCNRNVHMCLMTFNTLRPRQDGCHFQMTFSNAFPLMKMYEFQLKFHWILFPGVQLTIFQHLVQIMAWRRPGDKPLSEPMMVCLLTHICVTRPHWVNGTEPLPNPTLIYQLAEMKELHPIFLMQVSHCFSMMSHCFKWSPQGMKKRTLHAEFISWLRTLDSWLCPEDKSQC